MTDAYTGTALLHGLYEGGGGWRVKMQGCSEMIPIDTIFLLLKIYFITCFISVIFLMLVMAKLVVIFTEFLHIGKSLIYVLLVSLLAYKQELE